MKFIKLEEKDGTLVICKKYIEVSELLNKADLCKATAEAIKESFDLKHKESQSLTQKGAEKPIKLELFLKMKE